MHEGSPALATVPLSPSNLPNQVIFKRYATRHNRDLDAVHMNNAERALNREYLPKDNY